MGEFKLLLSFFYAARDAPFSLSPSSLSLLLFLRHRAWAKLIPSCPFLLGISLSKAAEKSIRKPTTFLGLQSSASPDSPLSPAPPLAAFFAAAQAYFGLAALLFGWG